ncbi:MAG: adenylate/guanylate cyclase domain-containing protein [Thermodesulfobacteriota bacterium]
MQNAAQIAPAGPTPCPEQGEGPPAAPAAREHPSNSFQNMAVLFTDVVGSTVYFKTFGDVAGRRMLKEHEDTATPPILEHGGVVVKMLGDSLMSYFFHPQEAFKAAIKIQQHFQRRNQQNPPQQQISVRIGVHFGEGILEEKDIFGDVVNMVAKFLPLIQGDEIAVSQAVFDQVQGLSRVHFEGVSLPEKEFFPNGFNLYRVLWEKDVNLSPMTKTLLYLRPLFRLGKANFDKVWDGFLKDKASFWGGEIERDKVREDRSLAIIVKQPPACLTMAKRVLEFLRVNLGMDGIDYLPIQVMIDVGAFVRASKVELEDLQVDWEEMEPGRIHISAAAYHILKGRCEFGALSPAPGKHPQTLYLLGQGEGTTGQARGFLYQNILVQGDLSPCFYCGSRRHPASQCPSKGLTDITSTLSRIGYLSLDRINRLFFSFLNAGPSEIEARIREGADPNDLSLWACFAFYELKYYYQLRFFRALWNLREEDWDKVRGRSEDRNYGGMVWIGLDCIRVSNLEQAETILRESLNQEPEDYKPCCALGILHIERNDFSQAKSFLRKALEKAQTVPQKCFVLFLISRIHALEGDSRRSSEMIRKVLRLNPASAEALYEEILLQFRRGKEAVALHQLIQLIRNNRSYYLYALIDPEISRFGGMVQPKLKTLLDEARDEANRVACTAREEMGNLKRWLGHDEKEVQEAESLLDRVEEFSKADGYFAYLDVIHYGSQVITACRNALQEGRRKASGAIHELSDRYKKCSQYAMAFPYPFLVRSLGQELILIHDRITRNWGMDGCGTPVMFKEILEATRRLSADLDGLESRIQRLEWIRRLLTFLIRFLKKTLLFQSANLLLTIILFPIAMYYLGFLIPGFSIPPHRIWHYQKAALSLGAVSGILLAGLMSGQSSRQGRRSRR